MAGTGRKGRSSRAGGHPQPRTQSPYEQLKRGISAGEFSPGFPLVEGMLAETFGVSRTPIREALTRLEQDGLVVRTERGLVVHERSPEEILDIYEVRILLAGLGARLAASRRTVLDLIRIRTRHETLAQADPQDLQAIQEANRAFHRSVWKASHNTPVEEIMDRLSHQITARYPVTSLTAPGRLPETIEEHRLLLEAIEAQDEERAAELARKHFEATKNARLSIWSNSQTGGLAAEEHDLF